MQNQENSLGVENLKIGLNFIAQNVKAAFQLDRNNDGVIDNTEKLSYATQLIPSVLGVIPAFPTMREEARRGELTSAEVDELVSYVQGLDFLPADKDDVENYVKRFVNWVNYNRRFIQHSIVFFQSKRDQAEA